jgi:hypothetical protein
MTNYYLEMNENSQFKVILLVKKVSWVVLLPFFIFGALIVILPTIFLISNFQQNQIGHKIHFIHFVIIAFSIRMAFYFTKVILWNLHGKEVINFDNGILTHYFDFKYFRRNSEDNLKQTGKFIDIVIANDHSNQQQIFFKFACYEFYTLIEIERSDFNKIRSELVKNHIQIT